MARDKDPIDPKGLIREAFRIDGISAPECRSIFVDWALSVKADDHAPLIQTLLSRHEDVPDAHPMKQVLQEGLAAKPANVRRGGRAARFTES
ncbi:hypothetical protein [Gymnodinialimonas ceratoperidinii]|uniref:Uncharacterized protein n=1 Tax=Gymnodinialimonas ceratoperidinii TaxID=2856823 RepID=A0A8F6TUN4_9RHOB|nr:hypothetical protein [Gymnodinialimonas ceratoperidinii]QXT38464.1 hypothetical protein KYE46_10950 [Gymnodinialimonas ceratoperidinii]